jgi:hypothetical protein
MAVTRSERYDIYVMAAVLGVCLGWALVSIGMAL